MVVGSGPGGSLGRFAMGSTTNQLLHHCATPLILVPSGYARHPVDRVRRIMVAFAQGAEGEVALARGVQLARVAGGAAEGPDDPRSVTAYSDPTSAPTPRAAC